MTIVTIGGAKTFSDAKFASTEINRIIKERNIDTKTLTVYGYDDSFEGEGAYNVAKVWAMENGVTFQRGLVPSGKGDWKARKAQRDSDLASKSLLLINLRNGNENGGIYTIRAFEDCGVEVAIVDTEESSKPNTQTPSERRKGDVPSDADVKRSVAIYSEVARKYLRNGALMLDTETTGKDANDEVIDLALGDCNTGKILYQTFIAVQAPMNPHATAVNHVTQEMQDKRNSESPNIGQIWKDVEEIVGDKIVLCSHNTNETQNFDDRMLNQSLKPFGMTCSFIWKNIQTLYRMYSCQTAESKYPLRTDGICLQLGLKKGTHEAKADVMAQIKILKAMSKGVMPNFEV